MRISKYTVVIVLAFALMAYGLCGMSDKPLAIVGTLGQTGISAYALITPNPAMHGKCMNSCMSTFPDKYSAQYRACIKGCIG